MPNFPTSVSTDANLFISVNDLQTTLASTITDIVTTIPLTSTSGFPTTGYVTIDNNEIVKYTGISGADLTGCTRGADGTTGLPHNTGVTVGLTVVAAHHNLFKDEVIAIETALGAGFTKGNLTAATAKIAVTGGTNAVIGSGATVDLGSVALDDLSNVTVPSPSTNDILTWNGSAWVNAGAPAASLPLIGGTMTGDITMSNDKAVIFKETTANGTDSVTLRAPASVTSSYTLQLPPAVAGPGQTLVDAAGDGVLSWAAGAGSVSQYNRFIVGTASGSYSGSTTVFDLGFAYTQDGKTLQVFYNGQMLSPSNYTETSTTQVTMSTALVSGQEIVFRSLSGGATATAVTYVREDYVVGTALNNYTGSTTVFNLVNSYTPGGTNLTVYLDGDLQTKGATIDYLETSSLIVTFNNALVSGQKVAFLFNQAAAAAGTVSNGTAGQVATYASTGVVVSGSDALNVGTNGNAILKGTTTNDSAAAGKVGEYIEAQAANSSISAPATGTFDDAVSISLTAGDWDLEGSLFFRRNTATWTEIELSISSTSGNSGTGLVQGVNDADFTWASSSTTPNDFTATIIRVRVSIAATTTYYLKKRAVYSAGQAQTAAGILSARRVR